MGARPRSGPPRRLDVRGAAQGSPPRPHRCAVPVARARRPHRPRPRGLLRRRARCSTAASPRATRCACSARSRSTAAASRWSSGRSSASRPATRCSTCPGARRDTEDLEGFLEFLIGEMHDSTLRSLVEAVYADARFRPLMRQAPVTIDAHHAYAGGAIQHTVAVATHLPRGLPAAPAAGRVGGGGGRRSRSASAPRTRSCPARRCSSATRAGCSASRSCRCDGSSGRRSGCGRRASGCCRSCTAIAGGRAADARGGRAPGGGRARRRRGRGAAGGARPEPAPRAL